MRHGLAFVASALCALSLFGCQTDKKLLSARDVVDDVEGFRSILDIKIAKYEKLVKEFPEEPKHRERLAAFYWKKDDHQRALEHLRIAQQLDPDNPRYKYFEAQILQTIGNYALAEACYRDLIQRVGESDFTGPHYDLAWLYLETDRVEAAQHELRRCTEIQPSNPLPWYYLGRIALEELRDPQRAIQCWEEYMRRGGERHHDEVHAMLFALQPQMRRRHLEIRD